MICKKIIVGLVISGMLLFSGWVAAQSRGKEQIALYGGKPGTIQFPHRLHQNHISDCQICHAGFARAPGAILAAKKARVLKRKQIMNKTCLKCHRAMRKAGDKTGPVKCSRCHIK